MSLSAGTRLGPYEIQAPIGAGGMGEVYRARDTRLDRTVAVKVAVAEFSERFEREARAVAALNHPHICTLHDVGPNYLVMEFIEGTPLKGPLPLDEALRLAGQMADALDAAHRKGITHRDLKPANVMVTKSGVKLLDFGLAKRHISAMSDETVTEALTGKGTILGTLQYMSPEQLQGKEADARSDIFAFGLVLYEMFTGRRAFESSSQASLIGAILHKDPPPVSSLVPVTPPALDRLIRRCLAKDPDDRMQSARDIAAELQWIAEGGAPTPAVTGHGSRERIAWIATAALGLAAIVAGVVAVRHLGETPPAQQVSHFLLDLPAGVSAFGWPVFSPDGSKVVLAAGSGTTHQLWLRSLDSPAPRALPSTDGARSVVFSPDSRSILFRIGASLRRLDLAGGAAQTLSELRGPLWYPSAWNRENQIFVSGSDGIRRVAASGRTPTPITTPDAASGEDGHDLACFLADGRHFLFQSFSGARTLGPVYAGSIDDPKLKKRIIQDVTEALYAAPGWLLFTRDDILLAQPFDAGKLELSGEPVMLADHVAGFSISETGSLVWRAGTVRDSAELTWFDRSGKKLETIGEPAEIANPVLSPDGKRVLITIRDPATKTRDVWIRDLARATSSRLTFDPAEDYNPIWSPDGTFVIFSSSRKGKKDIYRKRADGVGGEEELLASDIDKGVDSISPDGKYVLYNAIAAGKPISIWALPLGDRKPVPFAPDKSQKNYGQFSPNGRWIAYMSAESGPNQVFVQSAPGAGIPSGKWQVSTTGGLMPQWRRDGKELFYIAGRKLMAAPVKIDGTSFESGGPVPLFDIRPGVSLRNHFTATADGQRFLFAWPHESGDEGQVHVMLNWPALLKKP